MSEKGLENFIDPYIQKNAKILDKLREEIAKDTVIKTLWDSYPDLEETLSYNEFNIKNRAEMNAFYQKMFRLKHLTEDAKLNRLKERLIKETGELYQKLKDGEVSLTKQEIEKYYIPTDANIIKIKAAIIKQETIVEFYSIVCDVFKSQQWNMKTWEALSKGGW